MRPLTGIRILAFEQYGAGPFGTQQLADLGAEVIKVEPAGTDGDYLRELGPYFVNDEKTDSASSLFFQALNRNKKSITLNVKSEQGRRILHKLVGSADAVANNLRGDVPEKLGINYDALKESNPAIVSAHCSAYGRTGSRKAWPGYDFLMQAEAGYFEMCGEPDTPPARCGLSVVDFMAGQNMALGLVSAVMQAKQSGLGRDIDICLYDTAVSNLAYLAAWAMNTDYNPTRAPRSAHATVVPCQLYKTADTWIYLMCNKADFWPLLCQLIGHAELATDQRFDSFESRFANRDELTGILDGILSTKTTAQWMPVFEGRIPAAPVLTPREAIHSDFFAERELNQTLTDSQDNAFHVLAQPIKTGDSTSADVGAPKLGADTDQVLSDLGFSGSEIGKLRDSGTV
jgi:crotonobetainyl-CoA:carnitine CoA-transferase CaiB-like acyl-CoA transferase